MSEGGSQFETVARDELEEVVGDGFVVAGGVVVGRRPQPKSKPGDINSNCRVRAQDILDTSFSWVPGRARDMLDASIRSWVVVAARASA